jgi:chromosome segregation ATPase
MHCAAPSPLLTAQAHHPRRAPPRGRAQVSALEERLRELEGERAELAKFQAVDRQCRSLEYTIYDAEITDARQRLEQARRLCGRTARRSA